MDTSKLKKFAQYARRSLIEQVESKLNLVLDSESEARRESPHVVTTLENRLSEQGREQLIEQVAYTWFNRFCALRFMDANQYNRIMVISPLAGQFQPEILAEAKAGHIDENTGSESTREKAFALLNGSVASRDGQSEAFRLLIVAVCNDLHSAMPYMFERINDYTELLMPDDMLSGNSILAYTREAMTPEVCESVETIGWLYQFYISEKKDEVFAGLKKNQKITAENIPAATQLFTPHWIVRYLVENSLGRLWLLNRPGSKLAAQMDYYIAPEEPETDFLVIGKPEEIKICDPACGSGHMLTYAFDLLYAIYEEEGYDASEIPALILTHNLTGVEIDDRAGALAAFALAIKAAAKLGRRRFLRMEVKPDICVLQNVGFTEVEMQDVAAVVGKDLFTDELIETLGQFEQAKNFGSLIVPKLRDSAEALRVVEARDFGGDLLLSPVLERVVAVLRMAEVLSPKYHVVVANPPYMGSAGMNPSLKNWTADNFASAKADLMTCFMTRCQLLSKQLGIWGMINLPSWMFLSSFENYRAELLTTGSIDSLLHLGRGIFGSDFGSVAFCIQNIPPKVTTGGVYRRLFDRHVDVRKPSTIEKLFLDKRIGCFSVKQSELTRIPGWPISYWISPDFRQAFSAASLKDVFTTRLGMSTANNDRFLRHWHEVSIENSLFDCPNRESALSSGKKWFPYQKGGKFRKWYGNNELFVNWRHDGQEIMNFGLDEGKVRSHNYNLDFIFNEGITWSDVTSGANAFRKMDTGYLFDGRGSSGFTSASSNEDFILAFLNSNASYHAISAINPTIAINVGEIAKLPLPKSALSKNAGENAKAIVDITRNDWDAYETSWDFTTLPLLQPDHRAETLEGTYTNLRTHWQGMTDEMLTLEEENNRIFIDAYGLQDELTPEVPLKEITLTCNPAYRYGIKNDEAANEARLRADTMAEFLSYAVGCMFGRYSLEAPGLILANQGETLADYLASVPEPLFAPDKDNVVSLIDFEGDWFEDDISELFKQFLKLTFGEDQFEQNLAFIEAALGKDIKKYFLKDFYTDHVKRYKKRPIYWLFSSPKGSFNALIYMHRYSPSTAGVVLNYYLRDFRDKLVARKESLEQVEVSATATPKEKTQAIKAIQKVNKVLDEVNEYEHGILYPLASRNIEIDLDDGVKHNYPLFGKALKKIPGLS